MRTRLRKWVWRILIASFAGIFLLVFVGLPLGASFLITNSRFGFPERGPSDPSGFGLEVEEVDFVSDDGVQLHGWWNPGDDRSPVIVFVHGLNRSRVELLEPAGASHRRGYGTLLFDLRNHGESESAHTTLGVNESRDVCAAEAFAANRAPGRPIVLWGVSLGASTALLSANRCPQAVGTVADSAFLSFEETVFHHFELITRLPSFPIADLVIGLTSRRMGFDLDEGNVELAVTDHPDLPVLFVAGSDDVRMPPALARRLHAASANPLSQLLIVEGARHGRAFEVDSEGYLTAVFDFIGQVIQE